MVIKLTLKQIMLKGSFCFQCGKNKQVSLERDWTATRLEFPNLDVKQTLDPLPFYLVRLYCGLSNVSTLSSCH